MAGHLHRGISKRIQAKAATTMLANLLPPAALPAVIVSKISFQHEMKIISVESINVTTSSAVIPALAATRLATIQQALSLLQQPPIHLRCSQHYYYVARFCTGLGQATAFAMLQV